MGGPDELASLGGATDRRDADGQRPLHQAAGKGNAWCVRLLVERGADVYAGEKLRPAAEDAVELPATTANTYLRHHVHETEDAGRLKFFCCSNDGVNEHMMWLIGLKNIFAQQLPNRPKAYIVRLLMDGIHKSMMFIRDNHVIGGITYRAFARQSFGEIAFCAITPEEQAKGYATRLMNRLKQHARDVDGLTYLLTHADNKAVGYFIKQGFTKEITLETERWHGFIKNYENAILMEFKLDPKLPYSDLPNMILQQKQVAQTLLQASCVMLGTWRHECGLDTCQTRVDLIPIQTCAVEEVVKRFSTNHIKYPGIEIQKDEAGIPRNPIIVENIPGLREAGWTPDQWGHSQFREISVPYTAAYRQQLNACMRDLLKRLNENPDAWPFLKPVDACAVPDYYDIIKDPMDLSTVSKRLESEQYYFTFDIFSADIKRIFKNARTYNSPGSVYYECANRLEKFFSGEVQEAHPFLMSSKIS